MRRVRVAIAVFDVVLESREDKTVDIISTGYAEYPSGFSYPSNPRTITDSTNAIIKKHHVHGVLGK